MFRFGKPQELAKLAYVLLPDETLDPEIYFVKAASTFTYGILVLTNQRILYFSDGAFNKVLISYPLSSIESLSGAPIPFGMGYKKVTLVTANESVQYKNIPKQSGEHFIRRAQQVIRFYRDPAAT